MKHVIFLSIPGLRRHDLEQMPLLTQFVGGGSVSKLLHSFPAVTWPAQATLLTGKLPSEHGVVANGFYWRDEDRVEMWTAWNEKIQAPQMWDRLNDRGLKSAVWFPMLSKGCHADYVCMPAPIHNPDGSESLWCYTKPTEAYGKYLDALGHFPLKHFWGPLANINSTEWIVDSAIIAGNEYRPDFFYLYLPHLDYAAQKAGPDSKAATNALVELDRVLGKLYEGLTHAFSQEQLTWVVASEYTIQAVDHVTYPNRRLREAGFLTVQDTPNGEILDTQHSKAWSLVDHQFSHVFGKDLSVADLESLKNLFSSSEGISEVLVGESRAKYGMDHERSGDMVLISEPNSWQAYYYWMEDANAPDFARTVDIHRKPGYDPVELFFDPTTKGIPLDATLVRGSHGAPVKESNATAVLLCSQAGIFEPLVHDYSVAGTVENLFADT